MIDFFAFVSALSAFVSALFVILTYKVYKKSLDTRLYVISKIEDETEERFDRRYSLAERIAFKGLDFEGEGFPHRDFRHDRKKWILRIENNGDSPATNIKLKYRIIIYKNKIFYGMDQADIIGNELDEYVSMDEEIIVEYLPPKGIYHVPLIYLEGEFPRAVVQILYFKCNENKFINNETVIGSYEHPDQYSLADMPDVRKFLGTGYMKRKTRNI